MTDSDPPPVSHELPKRPSRSPSVERERSPPRKRPRTRAPPAATIGSQSDVPEANTEPLKSRPQTDSRIHSFSIQPVQRFRGASATIKRPREVAHFSFDDNHQYRHDESSISYYVPPPMHVDLKEGFDTFRRYEDKEDAHLDGLLKALVDTERRDGPQLKYNVDFVTWRGMMTKILTAPFDNFAEFGMFATLYQGTIYIEEDFPSRAAQRAAESSQPPRRQNPHQPSHEMMTYWGYKFETLALIPTPPPSTSPQQIESHQRSVVSNHAQHCSIVRTSFGPHSLLLGGEVDGLLAPKPNDPETPTQWVELKTSEELPPPNRQQHRDILRFERKLLKFWAQSFLLGVPKIIVGFRSKDGILRSLQAFNTHEIPGMVRRGTACWDGNLCINFAAEFLGWLKSVVTEEEVRYSIVLKKGSGVVEVRKIGEGVGGIVSEEFRRWKESGGGKNGETGGEDTGIGA